MLVVPIFSLLFLGGYPVQPTATSAVGPDALVHNIQFASSASAPQTFNASKCQSLADLSGISRPVFTQRENGEWECSYLMEYKETGHSPSLFLLIRGMEPNVWSNFRIKLNFGSLLSRQVLGARASNVIFRLVGTNTPLKDLGPMMASGRELEMSFDGIILKYQQERTDPNRYNFFGSLKPAVQKKLPE